MNPVLPAQAVRAVERLRRVFAPERVVLFGSYAKGTNHDGSDIDLLLVLDSPGDPVAQRRRAHQLTSDCFPPIDVVIIRSARLEPEHSARSGFPASALGTGITLFRRP